MDGLLLVNKPAGVTSHDVVDFIRRRFAIKKVGHAGTLDPPATGLLILLLGKRTKDANKFLNHDKEYEATMHLGASTDTADAEGKVIGHAQVPELSPQDIKSVFEKFLGEIEQTPPMVSAIKHQGKSLYKFARKGIEIPRAPRKVKIYDLTIKKIQLPEITFTVRCSKGTYIRTLCEDIGKALGCGAYQSKLLRIRSGDYHLDNAIKFEHLKGLSKEELAKIILNTDSH
ncbi:MAG: tRNA pseudouridine(55) synthase TruB [Candidatus Omnitrophota bacterium]